MDKFMMNLMRHTNCILYSSCNFLEDKILFLKAEINFSHISCELDLAHAPGVCPQVLPGHPGVVRPHPLHRQPVPHPLHLPQHADQVPEISRDIVTLNCQIRMLTGWQLWRVPRLSTRIPDPRWEPRRHWGTWRHPPDPQGSRALRYNLLRCQYNPLQQLFWVDILIILIDL